MNAGLGRFWIAYIFLQTIQFDVKSGFSYLHAEDDILVNTF